MLFNVPQFINIEDKIVGPLTAKQLGWLAGGGVVLLVLWNILDMEAFTIAAVIVGLISSAFAFYRPYGLSLISFFMSSVYFVIRPKIYVWGRIAETNTKIAKLSNKEKKDIVKKKTLDMKEVDEISGLLTIKKK